MQCHNSDCERGNEKKCEKGKLSTGIKVSLWHRRMLSKFRCIQISLQTKVLTGRSLFKKCLRGQDTTIIFW